jgi:hypothetical protein
VLLESTTLAEPTTLTPTILAEATARELTPTLPSQSTSTVSSSELVRPPTPLAAPSAVLAPTPIVAVLARPRRSLLTPAADSDSPFARCRVLLRHSELAAKHSTVLSLVQLFESQRPAAPEQPMSSLARPRRSLLPPVADSASPFTRSRIPLRHSELATMHSTVVSLVQLFESHEPVPTEYPMSGLDVVVSWSVHERAAVFGGTRATH